MPTTRQLRCPPSLHSSQPTTPLSCGLPPLCPAALQRYALQPQYAEVLSRVFGTAPHPLTTAAAINSWVSDATRGKITGIVDGGAISQVGVRLALPCIAI